MKTLMSLSFLLIFTMTTCENEVVESELNPDEINTISLNQIFYKKIAYTIEQNIEMLEELNEQLQSGSDNHEEIETQIDSIEEENIALNNELNIIAANIEEFGIIIPDDVPSPGGGRIPCIVCPRDEDILVCCSPVINDYLFFTIDRNDLIHYNKDALFEALNIHESYYDNIDLVEFEGVRYISINTAAINSRFTITLNDSNEIPYEISFNFSGE